jgi:hypothetical protein
MYGRFHEQWRSSGWGNGPRCFVITRCRRSQWDIARRIGQRLRRGFERLP